MKKNITYTQRQLDRRIRKGQLQAALQYHGMILHTKKRYKKNLAYGLRILTLASEAMLKAYGLKIKPPKIK